MTDTFLKWRLQMTYIKFGIGLVLLIGLIVANMFGTDRSPPVYVGIAATAFAVLFWGIKIVLLRRLSRAP
jgi:hypothetical protein